MNYPHCSICLLFKKQINHESLILTPSSSTTTLKLDEINEIPSSVSDYAISSSSNTLKLKITKSLSTYAVSPTASSKSPSSLNHTSSNYLIEINNKYKRLPKNSEVQLPEMCFAKHSKTRSKLPDFQREKIDCLLHCTNCKVTVHQSKRLL